MEQIENDEWSWQHLVDNGLMEYVDVEEEESTLICMSLDDYADVGGILIYYLK